MKVINGSQQSSEEMIKKRKCLGHRKNWNCFRWYFISQKHVENFFQIQSISLVQKDKHMSVAADHDLYCTESCKHCSFIWSCRLLI